MAFDISQHKVNIPDDKIDAVVQPAFLFFKNTPVYNLDDLPMFTGAGVYALYLKEPKGTHYEGVLTKDYPIYVGKAVPTGSRQGKRSDAGNVLRSRILKHRSSINQTENLSSENFNCRFMLMGGSATDMIGAMESFMIRTYNPLWNSHIDGFGINAPGAGRYNQSPSEWDTLHPGRYYAKQLTGAPRDIIKITNKIKSYKPSIGKTR